MRYLLLLLVLFFASPVMAVDYHFELVDSVIIPTFSDYLNHQVVDIDNDQYSEVIVTYKNGYFIYDFREQIYLDSFSSNLGDFFGTVKAYDYDDNPGLELLAVRWKKLYYKESLSDTLQTICLLNDLPYTFLYPSTSMYLKDIDNDNINELLFVRLGDYLLYFNPPRCIQGGEIGTIACYNADDLALEWRNNGHYRGLKGMEKAQLSDLNGDDTLEIVGYGISHIAQDGSYCPPYDLYFHYFRLHDHLGNDMIPPVYSWDVQVLTHNFRTQSDGDDIIVFRGGFQIDTTYFHLPSGYGIYCLSYYEDSLQLAWAFDSYAEQDNLFYMPSIPNTFCASNNSGEFDLYDGNTGDEIGMIHGLNNRLVTEEGHFVETGDSSQQLIQISGNTVYLYTLNAVTDVDDHPEIVLPSDHRLYQNRPNPFNPATVIDYSLARRARVKLEIYNLLGQKVKTLIDETKGAGSYRETWDGTDGNNSPVASGIYFYRLETADFAETRKMVLLR